MNVHCKKQQLQYTAYVIPLSYNLQRICKQEEPSEEQTAFSVPPRPRGESCPPLLSEPIKPLEIRWRLRPTPGFIHPLRSGTRDAGGGGMPNRGYPFKFKNQRTALVRASSLIVRGSEQSRVVVYIISYQC